MKSFNRRRRLSTALEQFESEEVKTNNPSFMKYGNSTKSKNENSPTSNTELMKMPSHKLVNRNKIGLDLG
jgi:hypothetical protein